MATEPQAFGSSFAEMSQKPDLYWAERLESAASCTGNWLLFAEERNVLVGMIGAFAKEDPSVAHIVSVYVAKSARGQGISKKLMAAILEELAESATVEKAVLAVNKDQVAALALYRSFGFDVVGEEEALMGNSIAHGEYVMEKPVLRQAARRTGVGRTSAEDECPPLSPGKAQPERPGSPWEEPGII